MKRPSITTGWVPEGIATLAVLSASAALWIHPWWTIVTVITAVVLGATLTRSFAVTSGGVLAVTLSLVAYLALDLPTKELLNWIILVLVAGMLPFTVTRAWVLRSETLHAAESLVRARAAGRQATLESAHSEEKRRIAENLHDDLGHQLSLASLQLSALSVGSSLTSEQKQSLTEVHRRLGESVNTLARTVGVLRESSSAPRRPHRSVDSEVVDDRSVGRLLTDAEAACASIVVEAQDRQILASYSEQSIVGRVIKESLTNALKHAPNQPISITVENDSHQLHLRVRNPRVNVGSSATTGDDDGATSESRSPSTATAGIGLSSLRTSVEALGGEVTQANSADIHELNVVLPAANTPAESPATETSGPPEDLTPDVASARTSGNRRLVLATVIPFALLATVISIVFVSNWWEASRSAIPVEYAADLHIGMSQAQARTLLPEYEANLSEKERLAASYEAPKGASCQFYAATADLLSDESGDLVRICFDENTVVSIDTVMRKSTNS